MINQQTLELFVYVDGVNDVPFFSAHYEEFIASNGERFITSTGEVFNVRQLNENIVIHAFTYTAQRMGSAPTISATIKYSECLDELFSEKVYAEFNGEKYFLLATPSSSYSNDEIMYKHDATFVSERIALENTYMYDVVAHNIDDDKPVSNSSKFAFSGNIHQFCSRLNASLAYSGLDYEIVVDSGINTEDKLVSVENKFFSDVLQEIYNTYGLPYYFKGKVIHIGYSDSAISRVFKYGDSDALVSINKTNSNDRTINRATGIGSSDNLPYYYPNLSPEGEIYAELLTPRDDFNLTVVNYEKFSKKVAPEKEIEFKHGMKTSIAPFAFYAYFQDRVSSFTVTRENMSRGSVVTTAKGENTPYQVSFNIRNLEIGRVEDGSWSDFDMMDGFEPEDFFPKGLNWNIVGDLRPSGVMPFIKVHNCKSNNDYLDKFIVGSPRVYLIEYKYVVDAYSFGFEKRSILPLEYNEEFECFTLPDFTNALSFKESDIFGSSENAGYWEIKFEWDVTAPKAEYDIEVGFDFVDAKEGRWRLNNNIIYLDDIGIKANGEPKHGDKFVKKLVEGSYIQPQKNLMPPIYRETCGKEHFYSAKNGVYFIPNENGQDSGLKYEFDNEYNGTNPKEQITQFEEIRPSIKAMHNNHGLRIDMFSEFAYDKDDNNKTYETEDGQVQYMHPIFFGKLRKLDFNLFDHALDSGEMTFAMTDGTCSGCEFRVAVDENDGKTNLVQVDENGNLLYDANGNVRCGRKDFQNGENGLPKQQDTINNEVWIALYKDKDTFGALYPDNNTKPKAVSSDSANDGDTFVILNIHLPQRYIDVAEETLRQQIVHFIWENNYEKFSFAIKFSRIFFAENEAILNALDENSRITIEYDEKEYTLYVSSLTYKATENELLPEITVELKDELTVSKNSIQKASAQVKNDLYRTLNGIDIIAEGSRVFLRKDQPDTATQPITFEEVTKLDGGATLDGKLESKEYFPDVRGLSIRRDDQGAWRVEADYITARRKFYANEVEIQRMYHIGGAQIKSAASMVCDNVIETTENYRCFFKNQDADGSIIDNEFVVGDQAYVQTFNLITDENGKTTNHSYWRLVTAVGPNFIDLSKDICAYGSTIPMVGDHIVQLGNRTDESRQVAVIDAGAGEGAPYYRQFVGINSFALPEPETQLKPGDNRLTGKVDIKDGSLLTGTVIVKDGNEYPTVMINGSESLTKNDRKVVIAAGVNDYDEHPNGEMAWVDANTTILDDGTINVGDKVGLSAIEKDNEEKVRIWAGEIETNKQFAPFRVLHDGTMIAQKAVVEGEVNAKRGTFENGVFNNVTVNGSVNSPFVAYFGAYIVFDDEKWWRDPDKDLLNANFNMAIFDKVYAWRNESESVIFTTSKTPNDGDDIYATYNPPLLTYKGVLDYFNNSFVGKDGIGKNDNLIVPTASYKRIFNHEELSWDSANNGRVVRFLNASYGDVDSTGYAKLIAPSGKYFYENGERFEEIIFSNQLVELIGWGEEDVFYGWIVLSRKDVQTKNSYGENKILYQGEIEQNVLTKFWSLQLSRTGEGLGCLHKPSDGEITILVSKIGSETISDYRGLEDLRNWAIIASGATVVEKSNIIYEEKDNYGNVIATYNAIRFNLDYTNTHYVTFQVISTADWVKMK